jgi:hypothetical protein
MVDEHKRYDLRMNDERRRKKQFEGNRDIIKGT